MAKNRAMERYLRICYTTYNRKKKDYGYGCTIKTEIKGLAVLGANCRIYINI